MFTKFKWSKWIYIICVRRWTITCSFNQIPRSEGYDKLSYRPERMHLHPVMMWLYITLQLHIISQSWFSLTNCNTVSLYNSIWLCFFLLIIFYSETVTGFHCTMSKVYQRGLDIGFQYKLLPSGRRYRSIRARSARLLNSFFPQAVRALNSNHTAPLWNPKQFFSLCIGNHFYI